MCLAVPMQIRSFEADGTALVFRDGLEARVDVSLIEEPRIGDHVIVHAGYAIEVLDVAEAQQRLELFRAISQGPAVEGPGGRV